MKLEKIMNMKTCVKCGVEHPATTDYFYKNKTMKDGMRKDCKECQKKAAAVRDKKRWENFTEEERKERIAQVSRNHKRRRDTDAVYRLMDNIYHRDWWRNKRRSLSA